MSASVHACGAVYRIHTPRLVLRCWQPADAPLLKEAIDASIEHLRTYMPWAAGEPQPLQAKIDLIRGWRSSFDDDRDYVYGIFNREETRVLGGCGLHSRSGPAARGIGYWIHKDFTHQGYGTEIAAALTQVAFAQLHLELVEIHVNVNNAYSAAIPRKLGYTLDGTLRKRLRETDGELHDLMVWSMMPGEYPGSPAAAFAIETFDAIGRRFP